MVKNIICYALSQLRGRIYRFVWFLVHDVLLRGHYKTLDVKKMQSNIQMKNNLIFSHQRSLATELTTFYLENKSRTLMG